MPQPRTDTASLSGRGIRVKLCSQTPQSCWQVTTLSSVKLHFWSREAIAGHSLLFCVLPGTGNFLPNSSGEPWWLWSLQNPWAKLLVSQGNAQTAHRNALLPLLSAAQSCLWRALPVPGWGWTASSYWRTHPHFAKVSHTCTHERSRKM